MWDRKELKARGKAAFKANYWKCVLVALILAVLSSSYAGSGVRKNQSEDAAVAQQQALAQLDEMGDSTLTRAMKGLVEMSSAGQSSRVTIALGGLGAVGFLLSLLVFNPLIVGCRRFFLQNSRGSGELNELGAGFKDNWKTVILTMFLRNLFLALWALLLLFPAIIKAYSYRLVPYLLEEQPQLSAKEAITLSRRMMNGHKWRAFVLDLSFLGWVILSALTMGILHIFYVGPYIQATDAELYEAVRAEFQAQGQAA